MLQVTAQHLTMHAVDRADNGLPIDRARLVTQVDMRPNDRSAGPRIIFGGGDDELARTPADQRQREGGLAVLGRSDDAQVRSAWQSR